MCPYCFETAAWVVYEVSNIFFLSALSSMFFRQSPTASAGWTQALASGSAHQHQSPEKWHQNLDWHSEMTERGHQSILSVFRQQENSQHFSVKNKPFICYSFKIKSIALNSEKLGVSDWFLSFDLTNCCLVGPELISRTKPPTFQLRSLRSRAWAPVGLFHLRTSQMMTLNFLIAHVTGARQHPGQSASPEPGSSSRHDLKQSPVSHHYLSRGPAGRPETDHALVGQQQLEGEH